eukprot:8936254-Prorocentrum_lima.AAC.1
MTSSLVGSEMCIRDRNRRILPYSSEASLGNDGFCEELMWIKVERVSTLTVSYTHLTLPTICSV